MNDKEIVSLLKDIAHQNAQIAASLIRLERILADAEQTIANLKRSPGGSLAVKIDQQ